MTIGRRGFMGSLIAAIPFVSMFGCDEATLQTDEWGDPIVWSISPEYSEFRVTWMTSRVVHKRRTMVMECAYKRTRGVYPPEIVAGDYYPKGWSHDPYNEDG